MNTTDDGAQKGNAIILHRSFWPTIFPRGEAAPAAIIDRTIHDHYSVGNYSVRLQNGTVFSWENMNKWTWLGVRAGRRQNVQLMSPWVPPERLWDYHSAKRDWREWSDVKPSRKTDVVIVWMPRKIFPQMKLLQVAEQLLHRWFMSGGIYEAEGLAMVCQKAKLPGTL